MSGSSPEDYARTLTHYSDEALIEETIKNEWLAKTAQMTVIDYRARHQVCRVECGRRFVETMGEYHD